MPTITFFDDVKARVARPVQMSDADLAELIANPDEAPTKADCRLFKMATFGDQRSGNGSLRSDANMIAVSGAEGDYDGESMSMQKAAALCQQAGIRSLFYTSASHDPEAPRWRVVVPFSKEYPPQERNRFLARLNGVLGGILAAESFTLSQSYYIGQVNGAIYEHADIDGSYIDQLDGLDAKAVWPEKPAKGDPKLGEFDPDKLTRLINQVMSGADYHDALNRIAASYVARGMPRDDVITTLQAMMISHRANGVDRWEERFADIPRAVDGAVKKFAPDPNEAGGGFSIIGAHALLQMDFPELYWNIQDILPAGTMLLFGKPKKGKSFLTLMLAMAVAAGVNAFGKPTSGGHVLYLGLEDSPRRLQRRVIGCAAVLGLTPDAYAKKFSVSTTAKTVDTGLIGDIREWMDKVTDTTLIVVDMLKKVNAKESGAKQLYDIQAETGHALTTLCHEFPKLTILVVHHSRKADSEDPFDQLSGTTGLSGSYDALAAVVDSESGRTLHITGRDIESAEISLQMNDRGMYTLQMPTADDMATAGMSSIRRRVYDAVPSSTPYSRAQIVEGCNGADPAIPEKGIDQQLSKLKREGLIKRVDHGQYQKTRKRWFDEVGGKFPF